MKSKTKVVEVSGTSYQLRKMAPDVGSYILMRMIAAGINAGGDQNNPPSNAEATENPIPVPTGEELVRAVAFAAFLRGLDYETHSFVQKACLATCSRLEDSSGSALPMPIVNDAGVWAIPEIRDDISLVMRLEVEALVFNLTDFFEAGGLNALAGKQASQTA